ncbi:MAG TPA: HEAT repeat domain-containing protein [Candidatus Brocadiia bacterium]|nr:HEAT repeat domain-containing protein [Planctomycetota bacterium]MDO8092999.1 HEAT repeat domain-containing protein [Candidatus Brocadiales bacterium]
MKRVKDILAVMVGISFFMFALGRLGYAKPNIPKEKIPSDIPSEIREQIERLYSENPLLRADAASELAHLVETGATVTVAVPFLIAVLKDEDPIVRAYAADAIGRTKDIRAIEPLIETIRNENEIKDYDKLFSLLRKILDVPDVRCEIIEALSTIGKPGVKQLTASLKDGNLNVRFATVVALGRIKESCAIKPLIETLNDESKLVRQAASVALGEIGNNLAVEPLIRTLEDKEQSVRSKGAEALGKIKDPRAVEPLIAALKDKDSGVRGDAALALGDITGQNFGEDPAKWQGWWKENKNRFGK